MKAYFNQYRQIALTALSLACCGMIAAGMLTVLPMLRGQVSSSDIVSVIDSNHDGVLTPTEVLPFLQSRIAQHATGNLSRAELAAEARQIKALLDEQEDTDLHSAATDCGNGTTDEHEECDDGNTISGDGCSGNDHPSGACSIELCGDGYVDTDGLPGQNGERLYAEQCDNGGECAGGTNNGQPCTSYGGALMAQQCPGPDAVCVPKSFDGCQSNCLFEVCGNGSWEPSGLDGKPGRAGVDDDGNGVIDDAEKESFKQYGDDEDCDAGGTCLKNGAVFADHNCTTPAAADICRQDGGTCTAERKNGCLASCRRDIVNFLAIAAVPGPAQTSVPTGKITAGFMLTTDPSPPLYLPYEVRLRDFMITIRADNVSVSRESLRLIDPAGNAVRCSALAADGSNLIADAVTGTVYAHCSIASVLTLGREATLQFEANVQNPHIDASRPSSLIIALEKTATGETTFGVNKSHLHWLAGNGPQNWAQFRQKTDQGAIIAFSAETVASASASSSSVPHVCPAPPPCAFPGPACTLSQPAPKDAFGCEVGCAQYQCPPAPLPVTNVCGDGNQVEPTEKCDDRNLTSEDGCSQTCLIEDGWSCSGAPSVCIRNTPPPPPQLQGTLASCGNGKPEWWGEEECDDGNTNNGDGCNSSCLMLPRCQDNLDNDGDGNKDHPEDSGCSSPDDNDERDRIPLRIVHPTDGMTYTVRTNQGDNGFSSMDVWYALENQSRAIEKIEAVWIDNEGRIGTRETVAVTPVIHFNYNGAYWQGGPGERSKAGAGVHRVLLRIIYADGTYDQDEVTFTVRLQTKAPAPTNGPGLIVMKGSSTLDLDTRNQSSINRVLWSSDLKFYANVIGNETEGFWYQSPNRCNNGIDDNSNGKIDEGCILTYTMNGQAGTLSLDSTNLQSYKLPTDRLRIGDNAIQISDDTGKSVSWNFTIIAPACSDSIDNDGDGTIDASDTGCDSVNDSSEEKPSLTIVHEHPATLIDHAEMQVAVRPNGLSGTLEISVGNQTKTYPVNTIDNGGNWTIKLQREPVASSLQYFPYFQLSEGTHTIQVSLRSNSTTVTSIRSTIQVPASSCGDSTLQTGEICEDGTQVNGDGCSKQCTLESGYGCAGAPNACQNSRCTLPPVDVQTRSVTFSQLDPNKFDCTAIPPFDYVLCVNYKDKPARMKLYRSGGGEPLAESLLQWTTFGASIFGSSNPPQGAINNGAVSLQLLRSRGPELYGIATVSLPHPSVKEWLRSGGTFIQQSTIVRTSRLVKLNERLEVTAVLQPTSAMNHPGNEILNVKFSDDSNMMAIVIAGEIEQTFSYDFNLNSKFKNSQIALINANNFEIIGEKSVSYPDMNHPPAIFDARSHTILFNKWTVSSFSDQPTPSLELVDFSRQTDQELQLPINEYPHIISATDSAIVLSQVKETGSSDITVIDPTTMSIRSVLSNVPPNVPIRNPVVQGKAVDHLPVFVSQDTRNVMQTTTFNFNVLPPGLLTAEKTGEYLQNGVRISTYNSGVIITRQEPHSWPEGSQAYDKQIGSAWLSYGSQPYTLSKYTVGSPQGCSN